MILGSFSGTILPAVFALTTFIAGQSCDVTPVLDDYEAVPEIESTNNLVRQSGDWKLLQGDRIFLTGHVFDKNCVPVSDATVEIWHRSREGETVSGKIITNNSGEYSFYTVMPESALSMAPSIKIRVRGEDFIDFYTRAYLSDHPMNEQDVDLNRLEKKNLLMAEYINSRNEYTNHTYNFNIVLNEDMPNKKY